MRFFYVILIVSLTWSCSSHKQATQAPPPPPAPHWVSQKPIDGFYYSGIGMAVKNSGDYLSIAKNNALNDLASEISVQIKSTSVLYQVEQNEKFREEFTANTRLKSLENIEGFELVSTYENPREYWVYYRLSKSEYNALKKARKEMAINKAVDFYEKAKIFKADAQYDDALIYGIKALEAIKNYLGDGLKTTINGSEVYLGNELFSFLTETVNEINISALMETIDITRGQSLDPEFLSFTVTGMDFSGISGLPIYFYYSGHRLKNNELITDANGIVNYPLGKIVSKNATEYLQANLNMVSITKEATDDPIVSKLVAKISGPEARIKIKVKKPIIFIKSVESNLNEELSSPILASTFKNEFLKAEFSVTDDPENADFLLEIRSSTEQISTSSGFFSASLNADIKLYDRQLNLLYTHQINQLKGVQLNYSKAGLDAYSKASDEISKRIFRDLRRRVFE